MEKQLANLESTTTYKTHPSQPRQLKDVHQTHPKAEREARIQSNPTPEATFHP